MRSAEGSSAPGPRTVEQWRAYLADYSADILRVAEDGEPSGVSDEQRAAGWLGYEGASAEQLAELEQRLGTRLPPSYRTFLGASDGWLHLSSFMWEMRTAGTVAWQTETDAGLHGFSDGAEKAILERALLISAHGDEQYWLLDPEDVSENEEWAAYLWASWIPGLGERHASFAELVLAERASFEQLAGYDGRGVHPEGVEEFLAQGRAQALRGEAEQAIDSFARAAVKGAGAGMYLKTILSAFLDLRSVHHEIRNQVLGHDHVVAEVGADLVLAEAVPLYLRRTVEEHEQYGRGAGIAGGDYLTRLVPELSFSVQESKSVEESRNEWFERAAAHVSPTLPEPPAFQQALDRARVLVALDRADEAWSVIEAAVPHWHSGNPNRIAPVVLLTDPLLRHVITPDRARLVVTTLRGLNDA
ncbi:SMI1/KNR4 family protein [Nocardia stercoris]|uniref:SMI1/KNR4 family protein n=1 Tax=Nocardia stercoris TaxID=2483361 RepID=A0A3M2L7G1_9NOCA|nr:SMI1/KNR4 family protein [Nocardia stercoris]RMI33581.1 SMI1/KNR4 family protein [Nocardia stercoris]